MSDTLDKIADEIDAAISQSMRAINGPFASRALTDEELAELRKGPQTGIVFVPDEPEWETMATAPKDGTVILAVRTDWWMPENGNHRTIHGRVRETVWDDSRQRWDYGFEETANALAPTKRDSYPPRRTQGAGPVSNVVVPERHALLELAAECMSCRNEWETMAYSSMSEHLKDIYRKQALAEAGAAFAVPPPLRPAIETILAEEVTCGYAGAATAISYGASVERLIALLGR